MCELPDAELFWEILFDCTNMDARLRLSKVIKFALCQLKLLEKEQALSLETETFNDEFTDSDGNVNSVEETRYKAVCCRYLAKMTEMLEMRAPKSWSRFDQFLDIFFAFMVQSPEEVVEGKDKYDKEGDAYKVGVEIYFGMDMVKKLGDFVLQEESPYHEPGMLRQQMGGSYRSANLASVLKVIFIMIKDEAMLAKYPLSEKNQLIVNHKEIIKKLIDPDTKGEDDFDEILLSMAKNNLKLSKKMAKSYLQSINKAGIQILTKAMLQIRKFLSIDDEFKL